MKRIIFLVLILLLLSLPLTAQNIKTNQVGERVAAFQELAQPHQLLIDNGKLYVNDKNGALIYSMDDFRLLKKFGKPGEGPGEFKVAMRLVKYPEYLLAQTVKKMMFFTKDGEYLRETRYPPTSQYTWLFPIGKNFAGTKFLFDRKSMKASRSLVVIDKDFKPIRTIVSWPGPVRFRPGQKQEFKIWGHRIVHAIDGVEGKIFVGDTSKGFLITVFDPKGEKLYDIKKDFKPIKISDQYKDDFLKRQKERDNSNNKGFPIEYVFTEFFPAYKRFTIFSGKLYVFTYQKKDDKTEVIVMDLKGENEKTVYLKSPNPFTIHKDRLYYLKENEDEEEWELFINPIK